ncbi:hypothetical protein B0H16DRAFT_1018274 [Mycena metata]|uniref:Uncharacterized protein n=1 Tax=Mycena metata TaxID=1033252 RepID=A0AAD7IGT6_9AGAR|nr:hypothetical protein B0H16DRAFT_1018274 [Mycena metata]
MGLTSSKPDTKPKEDTKRKHTPPHSTPTPPAPPPPPPTPPAPPPPPPPPPPPATSPTVTDQAATTTSTENDTGPTSPTDPQTPTTSQSLGDPSSTAIAPGQSTTADGGSDAGTQAAAVPSSLSSTDGSPNSKTGGEAAGAAASHTAPSNPQFSTYGAASLETFPVTKGDLSPPAPSASALSSSPSIATAASAKGTHIGAIIVGVIVPLFALLLALAAFAAYKRRKSLCDRRQWERTHAEIADAVAKVGGPATISPGTNDWTRFDSAAASRADLAPYANEKEERHEDIDPFFASRVP